ncbi:hypothetical protein LCGC14_1336860 [marine sediment metagenome]|uniref:DNA (cytosine-5-)-methyltransferase n=1 Tax=marine sediment metagenome TaxID=412755 RepID=A0A0F9KFK8_9ZZZZ
MRERIILDLCGGSGSWSRPYSAAGYDVRIIDPRVLSAGDVRLITRPRLPRRVHGVLAAPPCDHLSSAGASQWREKGVSRLLVALGICDACLRIIWLTQPSWWALENPVGRLRSYYGDPTLIFDPYHYGDPYRKKTLLWGNFTIPKRNRVEPLKSPSDSGWRGKDTLDYWLQTQTKEGLISKQERSQKRSLTPPGFAKAFFEANP